MCGFDHYNDCIYNGLQHQHHSNISPPNSTSSTSASHNTPEKTKARTCNALITPMYHPPKKNKKMSREICANPSMWKNNVRK